MAYTIYYDATTGAILGTVSLPLATAPAALTGQSRVEVADAAWAGTTGYHCPGGVYTRRGYLALSTSKTDTVTPYNGVPDALADGVDAHTITVQAKTGAGANDATRTDTLYVEVQSGAAKLSAGQVTLVAGTITFTVKSTMTGLVTLRTWHPSGTLTEATLQVQFAP